MHNNRVEGTKHATAPSLHLRVKARSGLGSGVAAHHDYILKVFILPVSYLFRFHTFNKLEAHILSRIAKITAFSIM